MSSRSVALLVGFLALVGHTVAQTPWTILVAKAHAYRQLSAADPQLVNVGISAEVWFGDIDPPAGTTVQLRAPNGTLTEIPRVRAATFAVGRAFPDRAALDAAYPDGNYTVIVGGSSTAGSSTVFRLNAGAGLPPVKIANFDALQAMRDSLVSITWGSIPGAASADSLQLIVRDDGGRQLYRSTPPITDPEDTVRISSWPGGVPLEGELTYARLVDVNANNESTTVRAGAVSGVRFPLRRIESLPTIVVPPRSQVVRVGTSATLEVTAQGAVSYQWKKDGVVQATPTSATLRLSPVVPSHAGTYTVDVINSAGRTTSEPATVVVAPSLPFTILAGQAEVADQVDGDLTTARFLNASSLAIDASDAVYVVDGNTIRKIAGGRVTTIAGARQAGYIDGAGATARFNDPQGIAVDASGTLYVADRGNRVVRRITAAGVVSTLAGRNGEFSSVRGIAVDAAGNVVVGNNREVSRITPTGNVSLAYRRAQTAGESLPCALAFDRLGNLFVGDLITGEIVSVSPGGIAQLYAGGSSGVRGVLGAVGTGILGQGLNALAFDPAGNLYAAAGFEQLWRITPTRWGTNLVGGSFIANGTGMIAVDSAGDVYVAANSTIRKGTVTWHSTNPSLAIVASPEAQTVASGDTVAFNVTATGPSPTYQWLQDGVQIPGANDATLLVRNVTQAAEYSVIVANAIGHVTSPPARVTPGADASGRIVNLSLRSLAGTGSETLIMGFAIGGSATSGTRPLLVRGIGPGLREFGVNDALADPRLNLLDALGATVASNDDWTGERSLIDAATAVGAFQLVPGAKDAALLASLPPKTYTAQVTGSNGVNGVALAEVYDANPASGSGDSRLINVSARTLAGTGDNTLTVGMVIGGSTAKTVLIRAIGPGLGAFGISDTLLNPKLELYSGSTKIAGNDDWDTRALVPVFQSIGAFPLIARSLDAALLTTLRPGPYTVQVSAGPTTNTDRRATSGITLLEIYEVP